MIWLTFCSKRLFVDWHHYIQLQYSLSIRQGRHHKPDVRSRLYGSSYKSLNLYSILFFPNLLRKEITAMPVSCHYQNVAAQSLRCPYNPSVDSSNGKFYQYLNHGKGAFAHVACAYLARRAADASTTPVIAQIVPVFPAIKGVVDTALAKQPQVTSGEYGNSYMYGRGFAGGDVSNHPAGLQGSAHGDLARHAAKLAATANLFFEPSLTERSVAALNAVANTMTIEPGPSQTPVRRAGDIIEFSDGQRRQVIAREDVSHDRNGNRVYYGRSHTYPVHKSSEGYYYREV